MEGIKEKIIDLYESLTDSGVVFYYGDDEIDFGEITSIINCDSEFIDIEIDEKLTKKVSLDDFKIYHFKENINLYDWADVREFDRLIDEIEGVE